MGYAEADSYYQGCDVRSFIPDELLNGDKGYARGPERALMTALLFDGVQAYLSYVMLGHSKKQNSRYKEAFNWVHSSETGDYIFSFENVCEALGMDPNFLRLGLINAVKSRSDWKKSRRNF